jgi:hypothetical protein
LIASYLRSGGAAIFLAHGEISRPFYLLGSSSKFAFMARSDIDVEHLRVSAERDRPRVLGRQIMSQITFPGFLLGPGSHSEVSKYLLLIAKRKKIISVLKAFGEKRTS